MKALILEDYNTAFQLKDVEKPTAGEGQVLVRIAASGVNPLDIKIKAGKAEHAQTKLAAILGVDMSGVVEAVGEGVTNFKQGDEVYGMIGGIGGNPGSLAEYVAADANLLALKPKSLSFHDAAGVPLVSITAWEGLVDHAQVHQGQTVLIHGGAGGVGHIAIQIAKAKGANVYSTVEPDKFDLIKSFGATPIDYTQTTVDEYLKEYTDNEGFDIVFDTVGGEVLNNSFKSAKRYTGRVLSTLGWGTHSLAPLSFRSATYSGVFTLYPLISGKGRAHHGEILSEAAALIEADKVKPIVSPVSYNFNSISKAYEAVETASARGKVVVDIDG
jgi:NADPH2:quinone reductase